MLAPERPRQSGAEAIGEAALGEPAVERRVHERLELGRADHAAGDGHRRLAAHERLLGESLLGVAAGGGESFGSERLEALGQRRTWTLAMRLL